MYEKYNFPPSSVFNLDEAGWSTVPNKLSKITKKGKRLVGKVTSAERGKLITAVCYFSAGGDYIPPALFFPRKRIREEKWYRTRDLLILIYFL